MNLTFVTSTHMQYVRANFDQVMFMVSTVFGKVVYCHFPTFQIALISTEKVKWIWL